MLKIGILEDIDLHVDEGENIAIPGPNGYKKTTLLNMIFGLTCISKG